MTYRILIVDDEPHVTEALSELIYGQSRFHADLYIAQSCKEAIEILLQGRIDLVISDIRMPEMDGLKLLDYVNKLWPACRVIFFTAYPDFEYAYEGIRKGIIGYILKSENDDEILRKIEETLSKIDMTFPSTIDNREFEQPDAEGELFAKGMLDDKMTFSALWRTLSFECDRVCIALLRTQKNEKKVPISPFFEPIRRYFGTLEQKWVCAELEDGDVMIAVAQLNDKLLNGDIGANWLNGVIEAILIAGVNAFGHEAQSIVLAPHCDSACRETYTLMREFMDKTTVSAPVSVRCVTEEIIEEELLAPARYNTANAITTYMKKYINENIEKEITLMDMASVTGYNADYLSMVFMREIGEPFRSYVNRKRMDRIRKYIEKDDMSLEAIAHIMNFKTRSYFNRFVRREAGCTPKQLRLTMLSEKNTENE